MEKLLLRLSLFVICILICKAIAWFLFNFSDQIIFERLLFEFKDWFRNGLQRVNAGYLIGISLVMFFCKGFEQNGKLIYKIAVIFVIWFLMNITVFRFQFLTAIGTCFVVYYFLNGKELGVFTPVSYTHLLGRVVPEKGLRYLIEAFKDIKTDKDVYKRQDRHHHRGI